MKAKNSTTNQKTISAVIDRLEFMNLAKFSEKVKMNRSVLSMYVNGIRIPSEKQLNRIIDGINEVSKDLIIVRYQVN